jgi:zinc/manganese transport system substrate-binding protein
MQPRAIPLLFALSLLLCLALARPAGADAQQPVQVVASFTILGDMVKNVGTDKVAVKTLVGPDGDAHVYEPTPADAKAVSGAGLVVLNGLGFDNWMERIVKTAGYKGPVCTASAGIRPLAMADEAHGPKEKQGPHGGKHARETDPHAWHDPANGQLYVDAKTYRRNAAAYVARLAELDAWAKTQFASIPTAKRRMITSHDALGYLGAAYGIDILSPMGFSTDSEPSAGDVGKLIRQIRKEKITAVFVENVSDPRLVEQIARESGATPGGELYSDALSKPDGPAPTYLDLLRNNVAKIVAAMRGN